MAKKSFKTGFIGTGNMAEAIINAIINSKTATPKSIFACDLNNDRINKVSRKYKINSCNTAKDIAATSDLIILAVKPVNAEEAIRSIKDKVCSGKLIISIMTGISISKIQSLIGKKIPVARVMPNTPALLGEGACAYSLSKEVKTPMRKQAEKILNTFCKVSIQVPEKSLNIVTALSGSGPAYFFYFAQAMLEYAKERGFDAKIASKLIGQTIVGAGKLILKSEDSPEILRQKVASKGGTTEKAITTMEDGGMSEIIKCAMAAAEKRAEELGK